MSAPGRLTPRGSLTLPEYPVDVAWAPDGRSLVVGVADGSLMLVQLSALQAPRTLPAHAQSVLALAWQKKFGENLLAEASVSQSFFRYGELTEFDFDTLNTGFGATSQ